LNTIMINKILQTYLPWFFVLFVWLMPTLPYLYLSQYVQPQYDDFSIWIISDQMYYVNAQVYWYLNWTGRYAAFAFISALHPIIYRRPDLISVISIIYQVLFLIGLIWSLLRILPNSIKIKEKFILSGLIWICYLWQLPSSTEAFYWIPATFSYQLGLLLCVITATLLWTYKRPAINSTNFYLLIGLAILIPGTSEITLLLFNGILFYSAVFDIIDKRKFHKSLIIILSISILFSAFSLLSPGNNTRGNVLLSLADKSARPLDIVFSLKASFHLIKSQILGLWFRSPLLGISIIYILVLVKNVDTNKYGKIKNSLFVFYAIAWAATLFTLAFPFIYKTGIEFLPGRVLNVIQFVIIAGWFGFLSLIVLYNTFKVDYSIPFQSLIYLLGIALILGSLIMPNRIMASITDSISGNARVYSVESESRYQLFENNRGKNIRVAPFSNNPNTIFLCDILPDSSQDCNLAVSNYFGLKSVRVDSSLHRGEYLIY
jgi:hypothetical protein